MEKLYWSLGPVEAGGLLLIETRADRSTHVFFSPSSVETLFLPRMLSSSYASLTVTPAPLLFEGGQKPREI